MLKLRFYAYTHEVEIVGRHLEINVWVQGRLLS